MQEVNVNHSNAGAHWVLMKYVIGNYQRGQCSPVRFTQENDCENCEQRGVCLTYMEDTADFKSGMPCCLHKMHAGEVSLTDNITGYFFPVKVLCG